MKSYLITLFSLEEWSLNISQAYIYRGWQINIDRSPVITIKQKLCYSEAIYLIFKLKSLHDLKVIILNGNNTQKSLAKTISKLIVWLWSL